MLKEEYLDFEKSLDQPRLYGLRVNTGKISVDEFERIAPFPIEKIPYIPNGFFYEGKIPAAKHPYYYAGLYYLQDPSAMTPASRLKIEPGDKVLDLCAAPGGKTTELGAKLQGKGFLLANDISAKRAKALVKNVELFGIPNVGITVEEPEDLGRRFPEYFDKILVDAPCSGEGMFRKDPDSIGEWSTSGVMRCQQLQRQIVGDIWPCLRPGGVMVYSTCTYNTRENEENVRWICEQTGAAVIAMPAEEEWGIAGSLLQGFYAPVCRFIPGMTRSEGLFMAVLRKREDDGGALTRREVARKKIETMAMEQSTVQSASKDGAKRGGRNKGHDAPSCAEALSTAPGRDKYPTVELPYPTAIAYLRREAIVLPAGTPTGYALVTFRGHPLGFVKNIGSRANNLYPREWAIRSSHVPAGYEPVLPLTYRA